MTRVRRTESMLLIGKAIRSEAIRTGLQCKEAEWDQAGRFMGWPAWPSKFMATKINNFRSRAKINGGKC
ncbi:hypothetical protein M5D96_002881 [Drosophila gunungcola]|uniref:Uncharacterized protein n=1 Tax=Drosophila gunungcola TaxID=103775 RepID=A0A9P9Z0R9_9MUSC|nr:hypothetical protein M5D96_002881 [Drosophila gunungcola]